MMQFKSAALGLLMVASGCAAEDDRADAGDDSDTSIEAGDPVNLDGRWILNATAVRGTCTGANATTGFDLVRLGEEDFSLELINPGAPYFGSVAINEGCDGSGDACFVAISLVSDIAPATQLTTFGLYVDGDGTVTGKMYAAIHGGAGPCEHYYSIAGAIQ